MFTFGLFYVFVYLYIILSLLIISFINFPIFFLTEVSAPMFFTILNRYCNIKIFFFFNLLFLTGLPPFGLFFVKFNILLFVLYQVHFVIIIILFLTFFFNMLYYAQFFNFKNIKNDSYHTINTSIFNIWQKDKYIISIKSTYYTYKMTLLLVNLSLLLSMMFFFLADLLLIVNL